jgi:hypothetical protein
MHTNRRHAALSTVATKHTLAMLCFFQCHLLKNTLDQAATTGSWDNHSLPLIEWAPGSTLRGDGRAYARSRDIVPQRAS